MLLNVIANIITRITIREAITRKVQKRPGCSTELVQSLKEMKLVDLTTGKPKPTLSTKTDAAEKAAEQEQLNIQYELEMRFYLEKVRDFESGLSSTYALITNDYCTTAMRNRIEEQGNFSSEIDGKPIALLELIKSLIYENNRAQYCYVSMTDSLKRVLNMRQNDDEELTDYVKRFKYNYSILQKHLGDKFLYEFIDQQSFFKEETDQDKQTQMKLDSCGEWRAYLLIICAHKHKYGTLQDKLAADFAMGNDNYPKTISAATDILSSHKFDPKYWETKKHKDKPRPNPRDDDGATATSFAQQKNDLICYKCGEKGHNSPKCPIKEYIPRSEWHINKVLQQHHEQSHAQAGDDDVSEYGSDEDRSVATRATSSSRNRRSGTGTFSGAQQRRAFTGFQEDLALVHKQMSKHQTNMTDMIYLDSGSTIDGTFMNSDLVTKIRRAKHPIMMATNAGNKKLELEATLPGFGTVVYDPSMLTNLLGLKGLIDKGFRITYDSAVEDAFTLYRDKDVIKFKRTPEGLYGYKPSDEFLEDVAGTKKMLPPDSTRKQHCYLAATVRENLQGFNQRQIARAKRARQLMHSVGNPTVEQFKHILRQKIIKDCPVTTEDVNLAERIYGPDVGSLKGKSTRQKPLPVRNDLVEIPPEILEPHKEVTLCVDIMFLNGMPLLTSIDTGIRYRALQPLDSRSDTAIYTAIDKIFRLYTKAGIRIKCIHADGEFKSLMDNIADELDIEINPASAQEHVPEAERNNRTIGERIRAAFHNLPYRTLPKVMWRYLAMLVTAQLNYFPAKGGASKYFSPHVLMSHTDLNYNKHCQYAFGAYVLGNQENDPTNTPETRRIDGIYLRPMQNKQGGHEIMNLASGQVVSRRNLTEIPIPDSVIKRVESMAHKQGMKDLKLQNRDKQPLFPANWIAGVDYEDADDTMDDNDEEYTETEVDFDEDESQDNNYEWDDELDDEEAYDRMDQDELDELLADERTASDTNPTVNEQDNEQAQEAEEEAEEEEEQEPEQPELRRSTRDPAPIDFYVPTLHQQKQSEVCQ